MVSRYLLRLDDACPTMKAEPWRALEGVLRDLQIKPLVAVIPDCLDPIMSGPVDPNFWDRVRGWRDEGWGIALHGLHHLYHRNPAGTKSLVPFKNEGEFVGLPLSEQRRIIAQAWRLFQQQGIEPAYFVAPSHSFDAVTLEALRLETPIKTISDGISYRAFRRYEFDWLPQQLWHFRKLAFGLWTVCLHPGTMDQRAIKKTANALRQFAPFIISPDDVAAIQPYGMKDVLFTVLYDVVWKIRRQRKSNPV